MNKTVIKMAVAGALVAAGFGLTACGGTSAPQAAGSAATAQATAQPVQASPLGTAANPLPFGQKSYAPVDVTISQPTAYVPSAEAQAMEMPPMQSAVYFTITATNHTTKALMAGVDVGTTATADSSPASEIASTDLGANNAEILPGHTLVWKMAYGVPSGAHTFNVDVDTHASNDGSQAETFWSGALK